MVCKFKSASALLVSSVAALVVAQPALALDAQTVLDRFTAVMVYSGSAVEFGPAQMSGDTITVQGAKMLVPGEEPLVFDDEITFSGVSESDGGSFRIKTISIPDVEISDGSKKSLTTFSLKDVHVSDLWLPPAGQITAEHVIQSFGAIGTGPLTITNKGVTIVSYDSLAVDYDFGFENGDKLAQVDSTFAIKNIVTDLTSLDDIDAPTRAMLDGLGLTTLNGEVTQTTTWTLSDGRMVVDEFLIDFADVGRLNFTFDISGFTLPLVEKLTALSADAQGATSEEAEAKAMVTMLEMAQALSISGAKLRYEDAGVATRALDVFAQQAGVSREQFAASIKPMVRLSLGQIGIPAIVDAVAPAVEQFLDNPQSIELKIAPPNKTSMLVLAAGAANPASLIKTLGIAVTANQ